MSTTATRPLATLQAGDRLTSREFLKRWENCPEIKRAELIEGEVFLHAASIRANYHGGPHADLICWLRLFALSHPNVELFVTPTVVIDDENTFEPDAVMHVVDETARTFLDEQGFLNGSPELIAEISASTVSIDLNRKKRVYEQSGVKDYLVWRTEDAAFDWFTLESGKFVRLEADPSDGLHKSRHFAGLWLDAEAMLKRDLAKVILRMSTKADS